MNQAASESKGKSAVVLTAGSSFGMAAARHLAKHDFSVTLLFPDDEQPASDRFSANNFRRQAIKILDGGAVQKEIERVVQQQGPLRLLVNCAARYAEAPSFGQESSVDMTAARSVIDMNITGTFNVIRLAATQMAAQSPDPDGERGLIITVSAKDTPERQPLSVAYAASQAALSGTVLSMAWELGPAAVRVCGIEMNRSTMDTQHANFGALLQYLIRTRWINGAVVPLG